MNSRDSHPSTLRGLVLFWGTLAGTLLMMAVEGPIITSVIARQFQPELNLAAYGLVLAIGLFCEGPILRILSCSMAIVKGADSLISFRRFALLHSLLMSAVILLLVCEPFYSLLTKTVLGVDDAIRDRMHLALMIYIPAPLIVGYRRLYQGILITGGRPRKVTQSTVARLLALSVSAIFAPSLLGLDGAAFGSFCHIIGMFAEVTATRLFVIPDLARLKLTPDEGDAARYSFNQIAVFYYPLALSTSVTLLGPAIESFFVVRGVLPLESLALLPVANAAMNPFTWSGYAIQDTVVALYRPESAALLRKFQHLLAFAMSLLFSVFVLSPLLRIWFTDVSQIPENLVDAAITALVLSLPVPAICVWKAAQRGILIKTRMTVDVLISELLELVLLTVFLWIGVMHFHSMGLLVVMGANTLCAFVNACWLSSRARKVRD